MRVKSPTRKNGVWGTLYDGVGSVKGHEESAIRGARILFTEKELFSFFHLDQGSLVNLTVDSGSTNHLFGHRLPTMIRSSDPAIARGSKAPNQASDELVFTRLPPGLPCLRTSRA